MSGKSLHLPSELLAEPELRIVDFVVLFDSTYIVMLCVIMTKELLCDFFLLR